MTPGGSSATAANLPSRSASAIKKVEQALGRDGHPQIGALPLTEIDAPTVPAMLRRVETRRAIDTGKRIRQYVAAIFEFAIARATVRDRPSA